MKSRRDLLKLLGFAGGAVAIDQTPFGALLRSVLQGQIYVQAEGAGAKRYIHFQSAGAPPRWVFDLFLTPYGTENFTPNQMVGQRYVENNGRYEDCEYATTLVRGINAPWVWQFDVPTPAGVRPMHDLLENALVIQGVKTSFAHEIARNYLYSPVGANPSIPAMSADASQSVITGVEAGVLNYTFLSKNGLSHTPVAGAENLLQRLAEPYLREENLSFSSKRALLAEEIDQIALELSRISKDRDPTAEYLHNSKDAAAELMDQAFDDIVSEWNTGLAKYQDLISRAIDTNTGLEGLTDLPIGITGTRGNHYQMSGNIVSDADLRTLFQTDTNIRDMAEYFTLAEYIVKNDLSRSVSTGPRNLRRLHVNGGLSSATFDEHTTGKMPSLLINSMYARAYASCLLELVDLLKTSGKFDETVIDISGDFNRSPRNDGSGSDHAGNGGSRTFLTGSMTAPMILGDTLGDSPDPNRRGSWGDGGTLNPSHMAATLASLLGTTSPVTNVGSLVNYVGGEWVPVIGLAKLV